MKLSIITINYNNYSGLQKTMQSVFDQTWKDYEYIIIDGGSTDGSKEFIELNSDKINYWVSEPDKGIYNAMNKGIIKSNGEYLLFLNSGDYFAYQYSLNNFISETINKDFDIIYGNQFALFDNNKINKQYFPDIITFYYLAFLNSPPHQATLIKRQLFFHIGLYDETMRMNSDWKFFMLAIFKFNSSYYHINQFLVFFDRNGISSNPNYNFLRDEEKIPFLKTEFKNFYKYNDLMHESNKLKFYYKYSRIIRILKYIKVIKKFNFIL